MQTAIKPSINYSKSLNMALQVFFKDAVKVCLKDPAQALYFFHTIKNQQKAAHRREKWQQKGIQVPPMMIISITNRCNLHCKGCYHQALRDVRQIEMTTEKLSATIAEAADLGVSFVILAGGEPLVRNDILDITAAFPDILFLMFTNGLLVDEKLVSRFKSQKNIVPLISLEGFQNETDLRRGSGVYTALSKVIKSLNQQEIFYGTSITITSANFATVLSQDHITHLTGLGCKMFFFVEYSAVQSGTEELQLNETQRHRLAFLAAEYRRRYPALFIAVPGDEKEFGGCLSAGRGFIHISASGDVEPCPFIPFSDVNLNEKSLQEALQSPLLKAIRESPEDSEGPGGCTLMTRKGWLQSWLDNPGQSSV
jgi:MoaA/NifB/PqqE/SkfB family radical SAM enzyme